MSARRRVGGARNPISGEVGAAAQTFVVEEECEGCGFQTPSAGRWVLQLASACTLPKMVRRCFKPHQRGGGCCSMEYIEDLNQNELVCFKPHQRGGGCCSKRDSLFRELSRS